ncbi:MAG TPA: ABC transporter ATP-binding protein [Bacilli bacterium]|nr:ABC transporter ATP-binding protein [Bacilli bacterium]HQA19993.1 ABC transporter ATP-binding protein [Bacilli bacterium]HQD92013.1 ABC transporter ATP-binding protein [Bacilli bacterium]
MFKKFVSYYRPHLGLFIIDMISALFLSLIDLVFPIATNRILKVYIPDGNFRMIYIFCITMLGLYIIRFILSYIIGYYGHLMGIRIETDMRKDLFKKFQTMDYQFFDDKKTGELLTNLTSHLHDVSEMAHHAPEDLFISTIMIIGSFIILMQINILLTLIVFVIILGMAAYSISRRQKMTASFRQNRLVQGELAAEIESSIVGIRLTKAYTNEEYEIKKFDKINQQYSNSRRSVFKHIALFGTGNDFFINIANLTLLLVGGLLVSQDKLAHPDLLTYFLYINFLIKPIARLTNSMEQLQQGFSGFERFYKVMMINPQIVSKEDAIVKEEFEGRIEFQNVTFQYEHDGTHVLNNFSLKIKPGEKIAIVGETGVGKSTISKLIPRFYDVEEGKILVDGIDVRDYDVYNLRRAIGHVQQDVVIFWGTIKDNILYGRPDASFEEVVEAAKKAKIHDFIMSLEDGYDTLVGERGVKLSGGQQQRISIARIFLKNPKILILDEATSSLDNITEKQIQESLDELAKGKTTIIIAHRLSTIKNADRIVVLGRNGIIEIGNHQELINKQGYYRRLYEASLDLTI